MVKLSSINRFLNRSLVTFSVIILIFILFGTLILSASLKDFTIFYGSIIQLSTGIFGIVLGFEINRYVVGVQTDKNERKIFERFISELKVNKSYLISNFDFPNVRPVKFQTTIWDSLKSHIHQITTENVIILAEIYFQLEYLQSKAKKNLPADEQRNLERNARETIGLIDFWCNAVIKYYQNRNIELNYKFENVF